MKFKRSTRYSFEFLIALTYVITFSLIYDNNILGVLFFSLIFVLGAIWFELLRLENKKDKTGIPSFSRTQRNHHLVAGILFAILFLLFNYLQVDFNLTWGITIALIVVYFFWYFLSTSRLRSKHGKFVVLYIMNFGPNSLTDNDNPSHPLN